VTLVGAHLCVLLFPAQRAPAVLGSFLRVLGVRALIHHLAVAVEAETASVHDAERRDVA